MLSHLRCLYLGLILFLLITRNVISGNRNEPLSQKINQKISKVLYVNPRYIANLTVFTSRISRRSPYLTTFNATLLTPWDNNNVIESQAYNTDMKLEIFRFYFKVCDTIQAAWLIEWLKKHSDVPIECPVRKGSYHIVRAELPPNNIPLPKFIPKGLYSCRVEGFHMLNSTQKVTMFKILIELDLH